jgi:hypothetical protein
MIEPPDGSLILVDGHAAWIRDDDMGEADSVHPDFHWWRLDGGDWLIDPLPWSQLETKDSIQLVRADPKKRILN